MDKSTTSFFVYLVASLTAFAGALDFSADLSMSWVNVPRGVGASKGLVDCILVYRQKLLIILDEYYKLRK